MVVKCSAIARSGSRCASPVLPGSSFCYVHDPAKAEARREAARRGGKARSNRARAAAQLPEALTPEALNGWLSVAFRRVLAGQMEPRVGTAVATIARAMLEVRATTELEQRLSELERRVDSTSVTSDRQRWRA